MNKLNTVLLLIIGLLITGCNSVEDPTLLGIQNVEVLDANKEKISLDAELVFNNPNGFSIDIDNAELMAYLDDVEVASFSQKVNATMKAKEEFHMPFHIDIDMNKIYKMDPMFALTKGLKILRDKKVKIRYVGTIYCGHKSLKIPIEVDREEWVNF